MGVHDFVAVGIGPFNLGLACLAEPLDIDGVFLEGRPEFDWHPGMMLDDATLQVPFLADLVTMADPTSPYSFLSFLKDTGRLYSFYIRESFYPLRREYNDYCRWAADRLTSLRFGQYVERVEHDGTCYAVHTGTGEVFRGHRLVLGVGTSPVVPDVVSPLVDSSTEGPGPAESGVALHTADYLEHRETLRGLASVTVVGSGQSAAEVYADLLDSLAPGQALNWVTRSPRFFPMEYTKLTLELTSPEYTAYFQGLPEATREDLLREQKALYKGISSDLVDQIFDRLYEKRVSGGVDTTMVTGSELVAARSDGSSYLLDLHHTESGQDFALRTDGLVLATGYAAEVPGFVEPIRDRIRWDEHGRFVATSTFAVDLEGTEIFVQNAEEHTHGFVAPDLGMGAHRNATLLAAMLGREVYRVEKRVAFQHFGVPDHLRVMEGSR
jgi:lysine N6-hydroxylase